ncbi:MAG: DUF2199 domain-containing protein, partial [Kribbellaceae bacterium]|nr:DUF2199 domain-containing protein [Kribbellaceae bacterium]
HACAECGAPRDEHDRHVRFRLPDPVLALDLDPAELEARTWGDDVLMRVKDVGAFVRCLLPVPLTGGYRVTFGVWLSVDPDLLRQAHAIWWEPEYASLELTGRLANAVPPWAERVMGAPAEAVVLDGEHVPYITRSQDEVLAGVLTREWPHAEVLAGLP